MDLKLGPSGLRRIHVILSMTARLTAWLLMKGALGLDVICTCFSERRMGWGDGQATTVGDNVLGLGGGGVISAERSTRTPFAMVTPEKQG